jgi:hypothetical protein
MKHLLLTTFSILSLLSVNAQSLFYDDLNKSTWSTPWSAFDSSFVWVSQIPITKIDFNKNLLQEDVLLWMFNDSTVVFSHYNSKTHHETPIEKIKYHVTEESVLQFHLPTGEVLAYEVGIVSTGNFAVLLKEKKSRRHCK